MMVAKYVLESREGVMEATSTKLQRPQAGELCSLASQGLHFSGTCGCLGTWPIS